MSHLLTELDNQLKGTAPIESVRFPDLNDKSTWEIQFLPSATQQEKDAAQTVIDAFVYDDWLQRRTASVADGGYGTEAQRAGIAFDAYEARAGSETQNAVAAAKALYDHAITVRANIEKPS